MNQLKQYLLTLSWIVISGLNHSTQAATPDAGQLLETLPSSPILEKYLGSKIIDNNSGTKPKPTIPSSTKPLANDENVENSVASSPAPENNKEDSTAAPAAGKQNNKGPSITVRRFIVEDATIFSNEFLASLLNDLLDQQLPLTKIIEGIERITKYYQNANYFLARAYLPPQSGLNGELKIKVIEGQISEIKPPVLINDPNGRVSARVVATMTDQGILKNKTVSRDSLERGVLLVGDLVGSEIKAGMSPGAEVGTTNLNLETIEKNRFSGNVTLDNYGSRYTGTWRLNSGINLTHPLFAGDLVGLRAVVAQGLHYFMGLYQFPLGYNGLKIGVNTGILDYKLCCGSPTDGSGQAQTFTATTSYPLILTQTRALHLETSLEHKAMKDDTAGVNTSDKRVDVASISVNLRKADENLVQRAQLALTLGKVDLSGNPSALAQDRTTAKTNGSYSKLKFNYSGRYQVDANDALELKTNGQYTTNNLDSSEKISLGGFDGIRAYPTSEGSGDIGIVGRLEWLRLIPQEILPGQLELSAFLDSGYIRLNAKSWPGGNTSNQFNAYWVNGLGIGSSWLGNQGSSINALIATSLGNNPNNTTSDGKNEKMRFWLTINQLF